MARFLLQAGRDHASENRRSPAGGSLPDKRWSRRQGRHRLRAVADAGGGNPVRGRGYAGALRTDLRPLHSKGSGYPTEGKPVVFGQGSHARRWPTLHHDRAVHPLFRGRSHPMDAVAAAVVDQRVIRAPSNRGGDIQKKTRGVMELLGNHVMTTFALKERETTTQPVCSVHPAALVFPEMSPADLDGLVEDIKQNGLAHPIVRTSEGVVLDGRNRLKACEIAGIDPQFEIYEGSNPV